jgi:hypothetical protein
MFVEVDAEGDIDEEFVFGASSLLAFCAATFAPSALAMFPVVAFDDGGS